MKQIIEPVHSKLPTKILVKKKEVIEFGERYGLTDERTIKSSQQLDHLLNNYQMVTSFLAYTNPNSDLLNY